MRSLSLGLEARYPRGEIFVLAAQTAQVGGLLHVLAAQLVEFGGHSFVGGAVLVRADLDSTLQLLDVLPSALPSRHLFRVVSEQADQFDGVVHGREAFAIEDF